MIGITFYFSKDSDKNKKKSTDNSDERQVNNKKRR